MKKLTLCAMLVALCAVAVGCKKAEKPAAPVGAPAVPAPVKM